MPNRDQGIIDSIEIDRERPVIYKPGFRWRYSTGLSSNHRIAFQPDQVIPLLQRYSTNSSSIVAIFNQRYSPPRFSGSHRNFRFVRFAPSSTGSAISIPPLLKNEKPLIFVSGFKRLSEMVQKEPPPVLWFTLK